MKKALSLLLALVMCLSLCACGGNKEMKKYAGIYSGNIHYYEAIYGPEKLYNMETLTLNADGTGHYEVTATSSGKFILEGTTLQSGDVTWEVSDNYIVVQYSGQDWLTTDENYYYHLGDPEAVSKSWTLEKKANLLMDVATGNQEFTKAQ